MYIIFENRYEEVPEEMRQYMKYVASPAGFEINEVDEINIINGNIDMRWLNAHIIPEAEAVCHIFFNMTREYVKIKNINGSAKLIAGSKDYFPIDAEDDPSTRYYMTDEDKHNTAMLMKRVMQQAVENWFMYNMTSDQRVRHIEDRRIMLSEIEQVTNWTEATHYYNDRFYEKLESWKD